MSSKPNEPRPRALGRGLSSLIGNTGTSVTSAVGGVHGATAGGLTAQGQPPSSAFDAATGSGPLMRELPLDLIQVNKYQPRTQFDDEQIESLASSIREVGVLQPVVVRPLGEGRFELISGERRVRACRSIGLETIPAVIRAAEHEAALQLALVENLQRQDLNPIERAQAYALYRDTFGQSPEQIAKKLGEDRSTVTNYLRLLELPVPILELVVSGKLSMGHARALLTLAGDVSQVTHANLAVTKGMSVRELEKICASTRRGQLGRAGPAASAGRLGRKNAQVVELEAQFSQKLGLRVTIQHSKEKGTGYVTVHYGSLEDFDHLLKRFGIQGGL